MVEKIYVTYNEVRFVTRTRKFPLPMLPILERRDECHVVVQEEKKKKKKRELE